MLGVTGDDRAEIQLARELGRDELDAGRQQELGGGGVELAQHPAELAAGRQCALDGEAVRGRGLGHERKAQQPDQGGVLEQVAAQVTHRTQPLVELDQIGCHIRRTRGWGRARPGMLRGAFGEVRPVQRAEQVEVLAGHGVGCHKGG